MEVQSSPLLSQVGCKLFLLPLSKWKLFDSFAVP